MAEKGIVVNNLDKVKKWLEEGLSSHKIGKLLNCSKGAVLKQIKERNLINLNKDKHAYSIELNEKIDEIYEMFKTKNIAEIAKDIGCSSRAIHNLLKKKDPDIDTSKYSRDYTVDESYFEKIDTHNKAYFLGMMYADGCVQESGIKIKLQDRDEHILTDLKNDIGYTGPLSYAEKANERCQDVASLVINRVKIVQDLIKLGATPKKSLTITLPTFDQVPEEFFSSFVRGLFDGDGSIAIKGLAKTIVNCYITGNDLLLKPLMKYFDTIGLNSTGFYYHKNSNGHTGMLCFTRKAEAIKFLNYIYKDATLKLNRKYEKALPFLLH
jgi:predicted transcriptional regulator